MAIRIIEGVPGSGKSYYAVKHLADQYFEKQQDGRYELIRPVTIITNIDAFQPEHLDLKVLVKNAGGIKDFFAELYQKHLTDCIGGQIVYIIDEAQKFFRKGARDLEDVYSYFEYHRHFGHDVYLITQNSRKLPPDIACLCEYLIVAAPRTRSVIGEFKYKWLSDGEILKREGFRPDPGIFALYKSMDQKESEKIKNPVMRTAGLAILAVLFVIGGGIYYFKVKWLGAGNVSSAPSSVPAVASATATSSSPVQSSGSISPVHQQSKKYPLASTSVWIGENEAVFILHKGRFIALSKFPWPIEKSMGRYWAELPLSEIDQNEGANQAVRRNDSASGSAYEPQGSAPPRA
jgi:zona occludens toxin (predicted ATPase)